MSASEHDMRSSGVDNDEIVAGQAVTDLSSGITMTPERAAELARTKALERIRAIITHLEQAIRLDVPVLPDADVVGVTQTQWPTYAQGWSAARDACLNTLAQVRKVGDRYEAAIQALGVEL